MIVPRGNVPCQPHSADGSSCGSTAGRFASSRQFLPRRPPSPRSHIVAQHGNEDDDEVMTETRPCWCWARPVRSAPRPSTSSPRNPERFTVAGLAAGGGDVALLAGQVRAHGVPRVAVADPAAAARARCARPAPASRCSTVRTRPPSCTAAAGADVVLNGDHRLASGSGRRSPRCAAGAHAGAGQQGVAGRGRARWCTSAAAPGQIVPVDSEHSALAQCLRGGRAEEVDRLVLTASGGPFRGRRAPSWPTSPSTRRWPTRPGRWARSSRINSATLVNKGLELIEAHLLFGVPYDRIDVVVHPQSIVHSMVTFTDGSTLAQASPPDMRLPIALGAGLAGPGPGRGARLPLGHRAELDVRAARRRRVPGRPAGPCGAGSGAGACPAVLNAANEEAGRARSSAARLRVHRTSPTLAGGRAGRADGWSADPATVADVLAAEDGRGRTRAAARYGARDAAARPDDDDRPRDRAVLPSGS